MTCGLCHLLLKGDKSRGCMHFTKKDGLQSGGHKIAVAAKVAKWKKGGNKGKTILVQYHAVNVKFESKFN